jgi:hypothetical protein
MMTVHPGHSAEKHWNFPDTEDFMGMISEQEAPGCFAD